MTIQIEGDKFYRTRDGQKVGPMHRWPPLEIGNADGFLGAVGNNPGHFRNFRPDGVHGARYWRGNVALDLVAEWVDEPTSIPELMQDIAAAEKADVKAEIADEAKRIVTGARRAAYGTPESNFERIARFWQAYFENTGRGDVKITARDVSPMMRLMKEARLVETPDHRDSFVDLVGYALTGAEVNGVQPLTTDKPQA